jgi:hypothetical protein
VAVTTLGTGWPRLRNSGRGRRREKKFAHAGRIVLLCVNLQELLDVIRNAWAGLNSWDFNIGGVEGLLNLAPTAV